MKITAMFIVIFSLLQGFNEYKEYGLTPIVGSDRVRIKVVIGRKNLDTLPDSLIITVYRTSTGVLSLDEGNSEKHSAKLKDGQYYFDFISAAKPQYFTLSYTNPTKSSLGIDVILSDYIVEGGDNINVVVDSLGYVSHKMTNIKFSGTGSRKYSCLREVRRIFYIKGMAASREASLDILAALESYRSSLKKSVYDMIYLDILALLRTHHFESLLYLWNRDDMKTDRKMITDRLPDTINIKGINGRELGASQEYYKYIYYKEAAKLMVWHDQIDYTELFNLLFDKYEGPLREKLLFYHLTRSFKNPGNIVSLSMRGLAIFQEEYYSERVKSNILILNGGKAKPFALLSIDGDTTTLGSFKGKIVVLDFWFTGCTACSKFYQYHLAHVEERFKNDKDVVFVSVCTDRDKEMWKKSIATRLYTSDSAINLYTGGSGIKSSIISDYNVIGYPKVIVLDSEHNVILGQSENKLLNRNFLVNVIDSLKELKVAE